MRTALEYRRSGSKAPKDAVVLTYDERFLRRKVIETTSGTELLVNLAQTTSLDQGGRLVTPEGEEYEVIAAAEQLLKVTGAELARLAWHIGNRHTPCQIATDHLLIQRDPVVAHMLQQLGAGLEEVTEPFTPEGGAYGHGRTHSHDHGKTAHAH